MRSVNCLRSGTEDTASPLRPHRARGSPDPGAMGVRQHTLCSTECEPRLVANNPLSKPLSTLTCNALSSAHAEQIISTLSAALSPALARAWADQEGSLGAARVRLTAYGV